MMDKKVQQKIFNKVSKHLLTQMRRSVGKINDNISSCVYRSDNGLKCAIGCLIPNKKFKTEMNDYPVIDYKESNLVSSFLRSKGYLEDIDDEFFLIDLQHIHDHNKPSLWKKEIKKFAKKYGLDYSVLDEF